MTELDKLAATAGDPQVSPAETSEELDFSAPQSRPLEIIIAVVALILSVTAILVLMVDTLAPRISKRLLANLAVLGLIIAGVVTWLGWHDGPTPPAMQGLVQPDGYSAFFAILFTARYPRSLFDFNVGVLRWTWRVTYYGYSALGTDRYPPFTLGPAPDYPATLEVAHPERLSRGLVLVKWWLLAIPQYLVLALIWGGASTASGRVGIAASLGLVGLLVLFAAVALLFTGRYPDAMFDLVMGLNRWGYRVVVYVTLLRDEYPPFRLDQGGREPAPTAGPPVDEGSAP